MSKIKEKNCIYSIFIHKNKVYHKLIFKKMLKKCRLLWHTPHGIYFHPLYFPNFVHNKNFFTFY